MVMITGLYVVSFHIVSLFIEVDFKWQKLVFYVQCCEGREQQLYDVIGWPRNQQRRHAQPLAKRRATLSDHCTLTGNPSKLFFLCLLRNYCDFGTSNEPGITNTNKHSEYSRIGRNRSDDRDNNKTLP